MFTINDKQEDGFDKVVLKDESSGTFAEVIPECGAILHSFTISNASIKMNVIEGYNSIDDFRKNIESRGFLSSKLSPFACRIDKNTYRFQGTDYVIQKLNLDDLALHGLLYDRQFTVTNKSSSGHNAVVTMKCEYRSTDKGYPFDYDCIITYELEKENKVNITTEVTNKSLQSIPIQDGWHPYFKLDAKIDDLQLEFQSNEMFQFDTELIPTGEKIIYKDFTSLKYFRNTVFDNSFTLNFNDHQPLCVLRNPVKKIEVEILPDRSYPYLHIYTPPHRRSIALENLSALPDSFNNGIGLKILMPGESTTFKTSYKINTIN
jgi:aldose 1-epimerase